MDLETYERSGRERYEELAMVVARILEVAINQYGPQKPQQIQYRAKTAESLRRKLQKASASVGDEIEPHAKDLAGVRLVFYTNSDVSRFLQSGIIQKNFLVDLARTKIHYPTSDDPDASDLFISNNYVVRLRDDRLALPEYSTFGEMWCEVQVQTTLNHAWAEMAHDTIYKKPELEGFGSTLMTGIEARMKEIMRHYLAPAGYAFDKVATDFARLSRGQELFEAGFIKSIEESNDNNQLHEVITKFTSSALPYIDDFETVANEVISAVAEAIKKSRVISTIPIETPFGNLGGKSSLDVAESGAHLIREIRFINPERTFSVICDLYSSADSEEERRTWIGAAADLAEHHIYVWEQVGPAVQGIIVAHLMNMTEQDRLVLEPLVLAILPKIFAADVTGVTIEDADTVALQKGAVVPSESLRRIRSDALSLLHLFYSRAENLATKEKIVKVYESAMSLPVHGGSPDPELAAIVFDNATDIVRRYSSSVAGLPFELRQKVEQQLLWEYRRNTSVPVETQINPATERARSDLIAAILQFRNRANADEDFRIYKLLVGFDSVFPPAWDDPDFDYEEEEAYRNEQIRRLVEEISLENKDRWRAIIARCAATESTDLATFPSFGKFLESLASRSPTIILSFFETMDDRLALFLTPMLIGLARTQQWPAAYSYLENWQQQKRFLPSIAWACANVQRLPTTFLQGVTEAAIDAGDTEAVFSVIRTISARDDNQAEEGLLTTFLSAVAYMIKQKEPRWVNAWWSRRRASSLLDLLNEEEARTVLDSLVDYPQFGPRLESFLCNLANTKPEAVIAFLGDRIRSENRETRQVGLRPLPHGLHKLANVLARYPTSVLGMARTLFAEDTELFRYRGGKIVELVYPAFSPELEAALQVFVDSGRRDDIAFVVGILGSYSGQMFIYPLCKAAIAVLPQDDPLLENIQVALRQMGITSGEFGRVNTLRTRRDAITQWTEDAREPVRNFAASFLHQMDQMIADEQRRSEERMALRRLENEQREPSDLDDDDGGN